MAVFLAPVAFRPGFALGGPTRARCFAARALLAGSTGVSWVFSSGIAVFIGWFSPCAAVPRNEINPSVHLHKQVNSVNALAIDSGGNVYVGGRTDGQSFPTTAGAYMRSVSPNTDTLNTVGFVSKLSADGKTLLSSTLFGGAYGFDYVNAIAIDASGWIHIAGRAYSRNFPVTVGGSRDSIESPTSFVALLNATASQLVYSTLPLIVTTWPAWLSMGMATRMSPDV
ncbi:MAG: hypothetical protein JWO19_3940 [Bryobacterales bacterium]|nr:hypothetical protein [Bryobacterales bacterium]